MVLDGERLDVMVQCVTVALALLPLSRFVEHDVTGHGHAPGAWVVEAPRLGTSFISDEDHRRVAVVELLEVWPRRLHVSNTPERAEVVDQWLLTVPSFIRCLAIESACRGPVQDVDHHGDGFSPEVTGQILGLQHAPRHGDDALVAAFDYPVLLRGVRGSQLPLNVVLGAMSPEVDGVELLPTISAESLELAAGLHFNGCLEVLDGRRCLIFAREQDKPHKPAHVVNQEKEVLVTGRRCGRDWTADVVVDEVDGVLGSMVRLLREGSPPLLAGELGIAHLFDWLDRWESAYHVVVGEAP